MTTNVAVLGAGSWGSALAILLANNQQQVTLWGKDAAQISIMQQQRCNQQYLPDITLPDNLTLTSDLAAAVQDVEQVLIVIPSHAYQEFLPQLAVLLKPEVAIASSSKGFCHGLGLHCVIAEYLGDRPVAMISGPSFAKEVAQGLPTALVVASEQQQHAECWMQLLCNDSFRPYLSHDVIGVEVAGSVKNVLAIATGIAAGMQLGSNAQAALITRGLAEITRLGLAMGAHAETFMGLAGMGDVVLTCTDNQSRNRRFGFALGQGKTIAQAKQDILQVIEGINTTAEVHKLAQQYDIDMPITEHMYQILFEHADIQHVVSALLSRDLKSE